jgi:glycosyltransferase involved in cell wall biosynthesis
MPEPLVSVIIPNFNYAGYLREAIDSALEQTYPNTEVVVVDDGSTDDSKAVLASYGDRIKRIEQTNQGVSAARNNGVLASSGEYIAFLDADDIWLPQKIQRQVDTFVRQRDLGLVHVGVVDIDAEGAEDETHLDGLDGRVAKDMLLLSGPVILGGGSGVMTRREVFQQVGGFDTKLATSADWDLYFRICRLYDVAFVGEVLLKYRYHGSNMHSNIRRMETEMMLGFRKAFDGGDIDGKRKCYSNLHRMLAGSYFYSGDYRNFLRQAFKSAIHNPANLAYFLDYPHRRLMRGGRRNR